MGTISVSLPSDGTTADVSDYNTPINTIVNEINGNLDNANLKSAAAIAGSKLADNSVDITSKASSFDGWVKVTDSWSYASSTTVTVPSDASTKFSVGDKVKFDQTSTKYFYVTAVSSTVLTLNAGSDYTVANAAISNIYYSKAASPLSFPQWFNFTPTLTNVTTGNGTLAARFCMNGKTVRARGVFTMGSTSSIAGAIAIALPITANTTAMQASAMIIGQGVAVDTGTFAYPLDAVYSSSTTMALNARITVSGSNPVYQDINSNRQVSNTVPITFGNGDIFTWLISYEAA